MELYNTEQRKLDDFIKNNLEPNDFNKHLRDAVDRICSFLRDRCFLNQPGIKVIRAVKGGSSGKGTALRNGSDADLVVFLNCFLSFQELRSNRCEILKEIQKVLTECARSIAFDISDVTINIPPNDTPPKSLNFSIQSRKKRSDRVDFDILPSFDAIEGPGNAHGAHLKLIQLVNENKAECGEFSACFTELQRNFVKECKPKLKDLIRLLKYWYKQYVKPRKSELSPGERLPAKYAVELLTIYAWEQGNGQERFNTAEGFRTVLELICKYQELRIYWTKYYDVNNRVIADFLMEKLRGNRPIILDPADPTGNVAMPSVWRVMVDEASKCLRMPCVSGVQAWAVQPMKNTEITVFQLDGSSLSLKLNISDKISMIKQQVQQQWKIPAPQQRLIFNETILADNKSLLDSGIFFDAKLQLLTTKLTEIFVRNTDGRLKTINVTPNETVSSLKNKIESLLRISSQQYYLNFESKTLEDGRTLESYGIKQHSTININLRLRGGKEIGILSSRAEPQAVVYFLVTAGKERTQITFTERDNVNSLLSIASPVLLQLIGPGWEAEEVKVKGPEVVDVGAQVVPQHQDDGVGFSQAMAQKMDLYQTTPKYLDTLICNDLQPDQRFQTQVGETIDRICSFLKQQCFSDHKGVKIIKAVKGGSAGKGTALKNRSDADLVIFISQFKSFQDQKRNRGEILTIIQQMLKKIQQSIAFEITMTEPKTSPTGFFTSPRSLNFSFQSRKKFESIEVDVLPAFDALGQQTWSRPNAQVYVDLIHARGDPGEFSTCFTELQKNFIKRRPAKLKCLIRLVKHWYKEYVRPYKKNLRSGEFLPPKYALELLIIHAWESVGGGENFNTAEGFCTIMNLIVRYRELWMFWTDNYDFDNPQVCDFLRNKLKARPMILDPADPTGNVAGNARWDILAKEAKTCLQQNCSRNVTPWDVEPVKDVLLSVESVDIPWSRKRVSINPFLPITHIKETFGELSGLPMSNYYLEWNGQVLKENWTLSDYKIFHDVTLLLKESSWCILM
ncbi:2'-5'-oligoadenylate synthase 2-like [Mustelus asterias]